jgi:hypothetical protein
MAPWHRDLHANFAVRAYFHWINEGRPKGRDRIHWYRAVAEVDPTFPLDCIPADVLAHLPEVRARMAWMDDEEAALERARRVDYRAMYGIPNDDERNHLCDVRTFNALEMGRELLGNALASALPVESEPVPFAPPTIESLAIERRGAGVARADAVEELFTLFNETPDDELQRRIEAVWPWEAAPLGRQIAYIDELHAEGSDKAQARYLFLSTHAHPFDKDRQDYARDRFEATWKNAVRRKSKAKKIQD